MIFIRGKSSNEVLDIFGLLLRKFGSIWQKQIEITQVSDDWLLKLSTIDESESVYYSINNYLSHITHNEYKVERIELKKRWWEFSEIKNDYVITESTGLSYSEIIKLKNIQWISISEFYSKFNG